MNVDVDPRDAAAVPLWNDAYDSAEVAGQGNLWGDPPVPHAERAARLFAEHDAAVVLDLPCGDGRNLPPLAAGAPILLAADSSVNAMRIAERVAARAGIRRSTVFQTADVFATGLLDNSVDGIFCWDLLGHLTNPGDALRELHRITRPGGHIVANMWTMNDCQTSDPLIKEIAPKVYIDHFDFYCQFYDADDLDALLNEVAMPARSVEVARWWEPPHAGYRDYEHEHESLICTIRKQ
ncbi:MAG TPA: class I SAM-dependent methyltransferase [Pseudonocardiaceae bacterium]|nr:class I SAM-dependent methyltransferase [Pseudonocardiaceae bacterium]